MTMSFRVRSCGFKSGTAPSGRIALPTMGRLTADGTPRGPHLFTIPLDDGVLDAYLMGRRMMCLDGRAVDGWPMDTTESTASEPRFLLERNELHADGSHC